MSGAWPWEDFRQRKSVLVRAVNSGLLDVHIKGTLVGNSSAISRNQLPFGGGVGAVAPMICQAPRYQSIVKYRK